MPGTLKFQRGSGPALWRMGVIFACSSVRGSPLPDFDEADVPITKGGHPFISSVLALAFGLARGWGRAHHSLAWGVTGLHAISDEFHQGFVPGRHAGGQWSPSILRRLHGHWEFSPGGVAAGLQAVEVPRHSNSSSSSSS